MYTAVYGREPYQRQYDHQSSQQSANQPFAQQTSNTSSTTSTPAVYENWVLRKRGSRSSSGSTPGVTELAGDFSTMSTGLSPNPSTSRPPNPDPLSHQVSSHSSNADYQFQSPQHAVSSSSFLLYVCRVHFTVCFCEVFYLSLPYAVCALCVFCEVFSCPLSKCCDSSCIEKERKTR